MYKVELWWAVWSFSKLGYQDDLGTVNKFEEELDIKLINSYIDTSSTSCYFICNEEKLLYFEMKYGEDLYYKVVKIEEIENE